MRTILLLFASNVFMTIAWYWHLNHKELALWKAILISWGIAFLEYCLSVNANRCGSHSGLSVSQLKIIREVITLIVFSFFAVAYLKEPLHWKYLGPLGFLLAARYIVFSK